MAVEKSKVPWEKIQTGTDTMQALGLMAKPMESNDQQNYPGKENPVLQEGAPFVIDTSLSGGK